MKMMLLGILLHPSHKFCLVIEDEVFIVWCFWTSR